MYMHIQVKGILGVSVLYLHKPVDIVKAIVIDDLHCLFLGVTKLLISLWFSKKYRSLDFYIGGKVSSFRESMVSHGCDCCTFLCVVTSM